MVLAPEHPLVEKITAPAQRAAVRAYVEAAARKSERVRIADAKTKTGVDTGAFATNPVNGARIPIWVADYVLASLRHRRDHGRARVGRARLRVRARPSACRSSRSSRAAIPRSARTRKTASR